MLRVRDHVAHVEVVRQDVRLALQREAQVQQLRRRRVDPAHQHALVADVADTHVQRRLGRLRHQRGHRLGVVDVGVDRQVDAAALGGDGDALEALDDLRLDPVLRQRRQRLRRQADVADGLDVHQAHQERLELRPRHVGDVAAGDHHVAHARGLLQVGDHRVLAVDRLERQLVLLDLLGRVADEVHPGAVAAVLRAGRDHLGQHLGRVAVGQALHDPHLRLVQRVALRVRVARPRRVAVALDREHVAADRVGVERLGHLRRVGARRRRHRVDHLRRQQHRHGRHLALVGGQVVVEALLQQVAHQGAQLLGVADAVHPLPLGVTPLGLGHVVPAREAAPVGFHQLGASVFVGLVEGGGWRHRFLGRSHLYS